LSIFSVFLLSKSLDAHSNCTPKIAKSSQGRNARQDQQTQREKITGDDYIWTLQKTFSSILGFLPTYKLKNRDVNYHHYYSPAPSGGPRATEGRICDAIESEAGHA
jgi:hypothetical protein